jgi:hypothetical protein
MKSVLVWPRTLPTMRHCSRARWGLSSATLPLAAHRARHCLLKGSKASVAALKCDEGSVTACHPQKKTPWLWSASEIYRPSDHRFLAKSCQLFFRIETLCNSVEVCRCSGETFPSSGHLLLGHFLLCLLSQMEVIHSSETLMDFHRTTQHLCCIFGPEIGYRNGGFSWFSSVSPSKCWWGISSYVTVAIFVIRSNLLIILFGAM